jgi:D-alanine-D-alanine ligase
LLIPAPLTDAQREAARSLAARAFAAVGGTGMARVDLFLDRASGEFYVNEINTIPGFTSISMYPKLWEASGLSGRQLVTRLIELALERAADRRRTGASGR